MSQHILIELELPADLSRFQLPQGIQDRLQALLDRQDQGEELSASERLEAEGIVDLADLLALLKLRAQQAWREPPPER